MVQQVVELEVQAEELGNHSIAEPAAGVEARVSRKAVVIRNAAGKHLRNGEEVGVAIGNGFVLAVVAVVGNGQNIVRREFAPHFQAPLQNLGGLEIPWRRVVVGCEKVIFPKAD